MISFYNWADDIRGYHPHLTLFVRMTSANEIWKKRISLGWMYRPHVTTNKCYALKIAFILKDNATNISESHHSKEKSPEEKSILGKRKLSRVLCIYLLFITWIDWFFGELWLKNKISLHFCTIYRYHFIIFANILESMLEAPKLASEIKSSSSTSSFKNKKLDKVFCLCLVFI